MGESSFFSPLVPHLGTRILIVKTSSLGDIIQAFGVLNELHRRFPGAVIHWAVEEKFCSIVRAHPLIEQAIVFDIKGLKKGGVAALRRFWTDVRHLRKISYDLIFDLQGNCKSGLITFFAKGKEKIGFGRKSVREWPNLLATNLKFEVSKQLNIRLYYLALIQSYFQDSVSTEIEGVRFRTTPEEKGKLTEILRQNEGPSNIKVMVCPGSKWINKQLPLETLVSLLKKIEQTLHASFLLVWGAEEEKSFCEAIQMRLPHQSLVIEKLSLPVWQNLMNEVDLVIAVDSSALHLCATTHTPSFSIFGPTSPHIFKPLGLRHFAYQGECPYGRSFEKVCPVLRSCATGGCIRGLEAETLFQAFISWWVNRSHFGVHQNRCDSLPL